MAELIEQQQPVWNGTDNHTEANQHRPDVVMERDEHEGGAETPQPSDAKAVEMQAKSGIPMLIPGLGSTSGEGISTTDDVMDVDNLPFQVVDTA